MALTVSTRLECDRAIVAVSGEVDMSTAPALRHALAEVTGADASRTVVVDLSTVGFLDSTALGVLVGAYTAVRNAGGRLFVINDHEPVLKVLRITALYDVLGVRPTLEHAISEPAA